MFTRRCSGPWKGICSYYDVGGTAQAAWSYRDPYREVERIADLISFEPDKVAITLDAEPLHSVAGQQVVPHGPGRGLTTDEVREPATPTPAT
jgi:Domain of unknown function (DUF427)